MADPMTWIAIASLASSTGYAAYNANRQKKAAQKQEDRAKANLQLQAQKAPEVASQDPLSASVKKYGAAQGIRGNILSNAKKRPVSNVSGGVGGKTLLGQ